MYGILIPDRAERGRPKLREERVCGLPVLRAEVPLGGWCGMRAQRRRLIRAGTLLSERGVRELLNPPDFPFWPLLEPLGLRGVKTGELCRAAAVPLTLAALKLRGWEPGRAVVALAGERVSKYLLRAAEHLAGQVARVVIDVPGDGAALAVRMHREYGLPVLTPGAVRPALTVAFDPGRAVRGAALELYDPKPQLLGVQLYAEGVTPPQDYAQLHLLAAMREWGLISDQRLRARVTHGKERENSLDNSLQNTYNS